MTRTDKIQKLYNAELALVREQASLLLQRRKSGFSGELKSAGTIVERYVRGLIEHHIPYGYCICSGYIATTDTINDSDNLLQHDGIIVDCRIPSIHKFDFGDIELVPAEAVCGIVEIKKTLTKESIAKSVEHLGKINEVLSEYDNGLKSKDRAENRAIGPTLSFATRAPMYAIIGLDANQDKMDQDDFTKNVAPAMRSYLDLIWAPASPFSARFALRKIDNQCVFVPRNVSRNQEGHHNHVVVDWFKPDCAIQIYSLALSCLRSWINTSSGAPMSMEKNQAYLGVEH